ELAFQVVQSASGGRENVLGRGVLDAELETAAETVFQSASALSAGLTFTGVEDLVGAEILTGVGLLVGAETVVGVGAGFAGAGASAATERPSQDSLRSKSWATLTVPMLIVVSLM